jgi:signal transduction histidine kinase
METRQAAGAYEQVAALFGHELSTPLATALLYMELAENQCGLAPSGVRSALQVARREIQRLKMLVDTLTDLERFGQPVLQPRSGELGSIVRATVQRTLAPLVDPVEVEIETSRPLPGYWDRGAVEQIVANLLSNALKFGQGHPIRVEARAHAGDVVISVTDRGIGVAPADRARIFERNVRAPARQGGGLGLGLWLVRELAVAHGGRVVVQSRKGRGSTFSVWLHSQAPAPRPATRYLMTRTASPRGPVRAGRSASARPRAATAGLRLSS